MCACAPIVPQTGGPRSAPTTRMTHISANRAHPQSSNSGNLLFVFLFSAMPARGILTCDVFRTDQKPKPKFVF